MNPAPDRTEEERFSALAKANEVRTYRAVLKRDLKTRRVSPIDILRSNDERLQTMRIRDVLLALPKIGRVKVERVMLAIRISSGKTIGGISDRQRRELVTYIAKNWPVAAEHNGFSEMC